MESVHDYPPPPRDEPVPQRLSVALGGVTVADSTRAHRVLGTTHPPVSYLPRVDVLPGALQPARGGTTFCEWKGSATYFDVLGGERRAERATWAHPDPAPGFAEICDAVTFSCAPMDACLVGEEQELWNGNRETLRNVFLSRDSPIWYARRNDPRRRRDYPERLALCDVVRLHSQREVDAWLATFG